MLEIILGCFYLVRYAQIAVFHRYCLLPPPLLLIINIDFTQETSCFLVFFFVFHTDDLTTSYVPSSLSTSEAVTF